jgi:hypothetical protein
MVESAPQAASTNGRGTAKEAAMLRSISTSRVRRLLMAALASGALVALSVGQVFAGWNKP